MGKLFLFFIGTMIANPAFAQDSLSARVLDEKGAPLSFVSVALVEHNKIWLSTATNEQGYFVLPVRTDSSGSFSLRFSLVGYEPLVKVVHWPGAIPAITMTAIKTSLGNVTVSAVKPLVTRRSDRYIINVENSFLANGNNGLEVLQRSPGLWVDNNGAITIRGSQTVMVMINEVVQRMSQDELAEYLKTLRSEDISRIEVIPNPPAEFEAAGAGGIVHIILKKSRRDGINGFVSAQYRQQGREGAGNLSASLDYKSGKLYLQGGAAVSRDINNSYGHNENIFSDKTQFNTIGKRHNENDRQQYRFAMAYEVSKNSNLALQWITPRTQMHHNFYNDVLLQNAANAVTGTGYNITDWIRKPQQSSTSAVYTVKTDSAGSSLKFVAEYTSSSRAETNWFVAKYSDTSRNEERVSTTPSTTGIYSFQADLTKVYKNEWLLRAGLKYAGIHRDNNVVVEDVINGARVIDPGASNRFKYNEDIAMAYAAVEKSTRRWSIKWGLRGEQTFSKGNSVTINQRFNRSYFGLFPSLFVTRKIDEEKGSDIYFSYSRRLQRPGFDELNPYRLQLSSVVTNTGNPDLQPQYSNNFELGHHFANNFTAGIYFSHTTGVISQISVPKGTVFESKFYNLDQSTTYGFNFDAPVKIMEGWMMNSGLSVYHTEFTLQQSLYKSTTYQVRHNQTIALKKIMDIDFEGAYRSGYVNATQRVKDNFYFDLGFSKRILKGKARVRLYFADLFNLTRESASTEYLGTYTSFYQKRQTQNIYIGISWNFNRGKKFSNKKIEAGSGEEKSRIGG